MVYISYNEKVPGPFNGTWNPFPPPAGMLIFPSGVSGHGAPTDPRFRHIVQVSYEAFRHFARGITSVSTCSLRGRVEHRQNSRISRTAASSCTAGKWVYISYVIYGCIEICEAKHGDMKYSSHSPLRHREFAFTVGSSPLSQMEAPTKRG